MLKENDLYSPNSHEILFSESSYLLGTILYRILKAERNINKLSYEKSVNGFSAPISTKFGSEVDSDEIVWWIKRKESNINELLKKTMAVLKKINDLKHDADKKIIQCIDEEYSELVKNIKNFIDSNSDTICSLYEYVEWLNSKDSLAPGILFNYRSWGSSMMNERRINIDIAKDEPTEDELKACTETACGVRANFGYTATDGINIECYFENYELIEKNLSIFRLRISHEVRQRFFQFIINIRRALQHIELEIIKIERSYDLLNSKNFWKKNITKIMDLPIEDEYWDFKKTLEIWYPHKDIEKSKFEFCEDIASMANSSGGVLIVGISNKSPRKIFNIEKLEDKLKVTKELIVKTINYEKDFTHFVPFAVNDTTEKNCLVIGIEQTRKAVSVSSPDGKYSWPVRLETGKIRSDEKNIDKSKQKVGRDNVDFMLLLENDISDKE